MTQYQLRRLLMSQATLSALSVTTHIIIHLLPGGYVTTYGSELCHRGDPVDQATTDTREWDLVGLAEGNVGSVNDPALEAALVAARHVPGCAVDARAEKYHAVQTILREDVPTIWLYARNDLYAARSIAGFAPLPGATCPM